jgi:hypothetical protein
LPDLLDRRRHISRIGRTHRLDGDGRITADFDLADLYLPGGASGDMHGSLIVNR